MRKLVDSWVRAHKEGYRNNLGQAIEILNRECGTHATYSRVSEWRRGKYTPSQDVIAHMLFWMLPWAIIKVGIKTTQEQRDALEDLIWTVTVKDGLRDIDPP